MSNIDNLKQIIKTIQPDFDRLAKIHGAVNYLEEASFAIQLLQNNEYLERIARGNPDSLKKAVLNVALIGLSLNPYKKEAYLVPRKGEICLDISYQGEINIHVSEGTIKCAVTELVYSNDKLTWIDMYTRPKHDFDPFDENRGHLKGGYVVALLPNDLEIVTHMTINQIHAIRDKYAESWKSGNNSPWKTNHEEMCKKTIIHRAEKSWPKSNSSERVRKMREVLNETNPILLSAPPEVETPERADLLLKIRTGLKLIDMSETDYTKYLVQIHRRTLKSLDEMTTLEIRQSLIAINQLVDQSNAKEQK